MICVKSEGLDESVEITKNGEIRGCVASFLGLRGFRGGCVVGVCPYPRFETNSSCSERSIAIVYCLKRGLRLIFLKK